MRKIRTEVGWLTVILLGFASAGHAQTSSQDGEPALRDLPATFVGMLPCADCPGIRYRVDLRQDHTFSSSMTYEERNASFVDGGKWEMADDGRVLVLHGSHDATSKFKLIDADTLRQLDGEGHEINSKLNYDLKRESAPAATSGSGANGSLENTHWSLIQLGDTAVSSDSHEKEAYFALDPSTHRVSGSGGCNRLMGSYEDEGNKLKFGQMAGTMMMCPEGMETERDFLQALSRVNTWKISDRSLDLFDSSGKLLARFEAHASE
jgi:copper homeostasis protein (lipoprotein)